MARILFTVSDLERLLLTGEYSVAKLRRAEIEFLWVQFEDIIQRGQNKDAETKLELLQRVYQLLDKTVPKKTQGKKRAEIERR
jgi:hypothetical protein